MRLGPVWLGVVVLVLIAGCHGPVASGPERGSQDISPVPVPTENVRDHKRIESLLERPAAFARVQAEALDDRSYTISSTETVRFTNGTLKEQTTVQLRRAANGTFAVLIAVNGSGTQLIDSPPARSEYWYDGERYVQAFEHGNRTSYDSFVRQNPYIGTYDYWFRLVLPGGQPRDDIEPLFRSFRVQVTERSTDTGAIRYRVGAVTVLNRTSFAEAEDVSSPRKVSFKALVDGSGTLRSYRLSYRATDDGTPIIVVRTVRLTNLDSTTVPPPAWYDEAVNESEARRYLPDLH